MSDSDDGVHEEHLEPLEIEEALAAPLHQELDRKDAELEPYSEHDHPEVEYGADDAHDRLTEDEESSAVVDAQEEEEATADTDPVAASDYAHEEEEQEEEEETMYHEEEDADAGIRPEPADAPSSPSFARVTYEYQRQKEDELDLKEGDILIVTRKPTAGGWWFGQLGNEQGWFPQDFVTDIDEDQVKIFLQQQKPHVMRKATLSTASDGISASSSPGTPTLSKQAAMAEMAQLQSELRDLEHQRVQLQQQVHHEREQRTKHLRSVKAELATAMLPLPNAYFIPSSSPDGASSLAITHFTWDVFSRDLLRCCSRLAASVDADATLQETAAPNLLQSLTGLTLELQAGQGSVKDDKDLQRMIDQLRSVSNPLMNLSANIDPAPMQTLYDLMGALARRVKASLVAPPPTSSAPPPPVPASRPSLPLSPVLAEDAPSPKRKKSSSKSPRRKAGRKDKRKTSTYVPTGNADDDHDHATSSSYDDTAT